MCAQSRHKASRTGLILVAEEAVEIRVLRREGVSIREIARMLEVSRNTVQRYLRSEALPRYQREPRPSKLDRYKQYIGERVKAAAPDWIPATVLLRELRVLGYPSGGRDCLDATNGLSTSSGEFCAKSYLWYASKEPPWIGGHPYLKKE